jgi:tRNA G18 (ribose-2'-O)-methylase SpoU
MIYINESDPRIADYLNMRFTPDSHIERNIFVAESEKVVRRLLRSDIETCSLLATPDFYEKYSSEIRAKGIAEEAQFTADKKTLESIVGHRLHRGILAIGRRKPECALHELSPKIVAFNNIIDAENVGAIIRSAVAFGIDSFLFDKSSAHPFLRRTVRVSIGAVFAIKYVVADKIETALPEMKQNGHYKIISAEQSERSISIKDCRFPDRCVLIFGSEGPGIEQSVLELSDSIVEIPVSASVDSLNVAATAATMLYEQFRQSGFVI